MYEPQQNTPTQTRYLLNASQAKHHKYRTYNFRIIRVEYPLYTSYIREVFYPRHEIVDGDGSIFGMRDRQGIERESVA